MRDGARRLIAVDALRDIRDAIKYWFRYAQAHDAPKAVRDEYLEAWGVLADVVLEVNH